MNQAAMGQFEVQKSFNNAIVAENDEERNNITKEALERITLLTMEIIGKTVEYIETPNGQVDEVEFIIDFMKNCDSTVYNMIRDHSTSLKEGTELKPAHITCANCQHEYDQEYSINPTDFFG
jgi:hypothetical protein